MIEISADLGEASTPEDLATERAIWPMIDAANVACGGHAGDDASMRAAVVSASRLGVILGAHPSYPDREHFGRRSMMIDPAILEQSLIAQMESLRRVASAEGVALDRVKPHGALYNDAHHDAALAAVIIEAVRAVDPQLAIVTSPSSRMAEAAVKLGIRVVREAFADRRYQLDGSLVPRSEPDALLSVPEAVAQAELLASQRVVNARGQRIGLEFDTLCIHADMPGSVERLQAIRQALAQRHPKTSRLIP